MSKVQEIRESTPSVSCTRWSIAYNIIFVLNLATTPFMAYLTEPLPWRVGSTQMPQTTSFDGFVNTTSAYFQHIFNNETVQGHSRLDNAVNAFSIWRELTLPFEIPQSDAIDYIIHMPGSTFFGAGLRAFAINFLTSNATSRDQMQPWQKCQYSVILGLKLCDVCIWLKKTKENVYAVWIAAAILDTPAASWAKFVYRSLLTCYVLYVLWTRNYRHYRTLLSNLEQFGLSPKYTQYRVVVGDPAYAVLSDPFVSVAMVIDMLSSVSYIGIALIQVTQFQDLWLYTSGCFYLSRGVWYAYLMMRTLSFVAKRRGTIVSIMGTTHLIWLFYFMWSMLLPQALEDQVIETITAIAVLFIVISSLPIVFSRLATKWRHRIRIYPTNAGGQNVSDYTFNDMKAYILLVLTMHKQAVDATGGTLHKLYQENPRYKKIPLFSHRAADCFVLCYTAEGHLGQRARLSLLSCLDTRDNDPQNMIMKCKAGHSTAVGVINHEACAAFMPNSKNTKCIHLGSSNCPWIM
ncbi:hypothetical protein AeRB84_014562 [Aphanomyces euteiches]|nr:hypothetical protein AeRB84_014562 [Aphanomyces euteiches]